MTVKAYIPHDTQEREQAYNWEHERRAILDLIKSVRRLYHASAKFYAIVANVKSPPADVIIVAEDGVGIIELKSYGGWLRGDNHNPWTVTSGSKTDRIDAGQKNNKARLNPLQQVSDYTEILKRRLEQVAQGRFSLIPHWLPSARWQTTVCFTKKIEWNQKSLQINKSGFRITTLDNIAEWVGTLAFGQGKQLKQTEILFIVSHILESQEWPEVDVPPTVPYGYLWVLENGQDAWRLVLDQDDMCIGRDPECGALMLDEAVYPRVSRRHAQIRQEGEKIFIYDGYRNEPSTNGTYVNSARIDRIKGKRLEEGDKIVLGDYEDKERNHPKTGTCILRFSRFNLNHKPGKTLR